MCNCNHLPNTGLIPELDDILIGLRSHNTISHELEGDAVTQPVKTKTVIKPAALPLSGTVVTPAACFTSHTNLIPRYLEPKLMGCLNKVVSTANTEILFRKTLEANPGSVWIKKLNTDLQTFSNYLYPKVNLTVELWRMITIPTGNQRSALVPLAAYLKAKAGDFTLSIFAPLSSQKTVEKIYNGALDKFVASAGTLPSSNYSYYWHVYVTFPDEVKNNFRSIEWTNIDKFPFNKYELSSEQQKKISQVAFDIVESWVITSPKRYIKVILEGHTDIRGTEAYNKELGRKRAAEAAKFLRAEIYRIAPAYYLDPSKIKIAYEIKSYGETRPVSKTPPVIHEFNRRVEITLQGINMPEGKLLDIDEVIARSLVVLNSKKTSMNADFYNRIHCILLAMKNPQTDDRFITGQAALNIYNSNKFPGKDEWSRLRFFLTNSSFFGKTRPANKIFDALVSIDNMMRGGVEEISRKVNAYTAVMYLPLPKAFNDLVQWVSKQAADKKSIYSCGY